MKSALVHALPVFATVMLCVSSGLAYGQDVRAQSAPPMPAASKNTAIVQGPSFSSLSANQKSVLAPLEPFWDEMAEVRRKKWMEIANRFPSTGEEEQARVKIRMQEWATLSPAQRKLVRENFVDSQKVSKTQKQMQWEEYQKLSDEEKRLFIEQASKNQVKSSDTAGPMGAAAATRANAKTTAPVKSNTSDSAVK